MEFFQNRGSMVKSIILGIDTCYKDFDFLKSVQMRLGYTV